MGVTVAYFGSINTDSVKDWAGWSRTHRRSCPRASRGQHEPEAKPRAVAILASALRRSRLRLTQTRPVFHHLGLGREQCAQLTLLLGNEHADHLPAYLRHAHATQSRNTVQPDQH